MTSPWLECLAPWVHDRTLARSTVLYCLASMLLLGLLWALQAYALATPSVLALHDGERLQLAHAALGALMAWLTLAGTLAWWAHDRDESPGWWLSYATVTPTLIMLVALWIGYGMTDTPMAMVVVEALIVGRALFELRVLVPGMALGLGLVVACLVLQSQGVMKHAPMLMGSVFAGGALAWWWRLLALVFNLSVVPFLIVLIMLFRGLAHHRIELEALARTDMLTGLMNRREFMDRLSRESLRHERNGQRASIIMIDIDHFKQVNDVHGHAAGDAVLERLGRFLREQFRQHIDIAARLGGEEFAVLLPGTPLDGARTAALKLGQTLRQERFAHQGRAFQVTVSAGVAEVQGGQGEAALRAADDLLYRAKAEGRDRVVTTLD